MAKAYRIVGLTGMAQDPEGNQSILGAGKDAAADFLVRDHGFVKISLADEMKRTARRWFPEFTVEHLWGPSEKRAEPVEVAPGVTLTARHVLQQMGTEVGRGIWPDMWVHYTVNTAKKLLEAEGQAKYIPYEGLTYLQDYRDWGEMDRRYEDRPRGVVIPDMRFPNEMYRISKGGGTVARVFRPVAEVRSAETKHSSEQAILVIPDEEFDFVIRNDGSLDDLKERVNCLLNR